MMRTKIYSKACRVAHEGRLECKDRMERIRHLEEGGKGGLLSMGVFEF